MGYAIAMGDCCCCHNMFSFNPVSVPSIRDANGIRQPICRNCYERAQVIRKERGLPPLPALRPDAYEACEEGEL